MSSANAQTETRVDTTNDTTAILRAEDPLTEQRGGLGGLPVPLEGATSDLNEPTLQPESTIAQPTSEKTGDPDLPVITVRVYND